MSGREEVEVVPRPSGRSTPQVQDGAVPAAASEARDCPFCGERLTQHTMSSGMPVWSHSLDEPCVARGMAISSAGLAMWNRRAEDKQWASWGVIEVMIRNPAVNEFVKDKETEIDRLTAAIATLRDSVVEMEAYNDVPGAQDDPVWRAIRTRGAVAITQAAAVERAEQGRSAAEHAPKPSEA